MNKDIAFPETSHPVDYSAKKALASHFNQLVEDRGLNQKQISAITGMTQPKVSQIKNYNLKNISLERLINALVALDQRVDIIITHSKNNDSACINVRY
ncbi:helix-turn-helix domain-containing protein [Sutterella sp.]|uniref:helix-turn-helix domain-containing protein n=1 Tax=Sutterella sp. TaxID=1981025 RepID=UPI0026DED5EC|nr:helix-turn-helix transcriptional regulator [Sutterella sp.]MDO5530926.1 helix-turn-helix transcriptional regulator [Sutterella sp.]